MEKNKFHFPQELRYPFFLIGLLIIIGGGLGAIKLDLPEMYDFTIAAVGFIFLVLAVVFS